MYCTCGGNLRGGTLEIGGTNPVVNVSKLLRCWNGNTYVNPSYVTFDIPAESWAAAPVVVFCHQRLDGTGSYFVKNAAEVRQIIEKSCKVIGVFAGHEHAGGRNCMNGVSYYTLRSLAESGQSFEVACYSNGVSVFGRV